MNGQSFSTVLTVVAIVAITIVSGLVHGMMSSRWGPSADLIAAGNSLANVPKTFGDWETSHEETIDPSAAAMLRCTGSVFRTYVNRTTMQSVKMAILVGPPGPISVHTPEICFSSRDYRQVDERERVHIDTNDPSHAGDFWSVTFQRNDLAGSPLRVMYAWSDGGSWEADDNPRYALSRAKLLYKIQLAADVPAVSADSVDVDPCKQFLESFLAVGVSKQLGRHP